MSIESMFVNDMLQSTLDDELADAATELRAFKMYGLASSIEKARRLLALAQEAPAPAETAPRLVAITGGGSS